MDRLGCLSVQTSIGISSRPDALPFLKVLIHFKSSSLVRSSVFIGSILLTTSVISTSRIVGGCPKRFWKWFFYFCNLSFGLSAFIFPDGVFFRPVISFTVSQARQNCWFSAACEIISTF